MRLPDMDSIEERARGAHWEHTPPGFVPLNVAASVADVPILVAEVRRLRGVVERIEALADGPNQPGRWVLPDDEDEPSVWLTDLRAALDGTAS